MTQLKKLNEGKTNLWHFNLIVTENVNCWSSEKSKTSKRKVLPLNKSLGNFPQRPETQYVHIKQSLTSWIIR